MSKLRESLIRLSETLWLGRSDRDLEEELRLHRELAEEHARRGAATPEQAARTARIRVGGTAQAMEALRDQHSVPWLRDLGRDVRFGCRMLRRNPGFTAVAVTTLALGIGATTAIFSVVNSLLLRPLPVVEPERLVTVSSDQAISLGFTAGAGWNYAMWDQLRQRADAFGGAFAWSTDTFNLARGGEIDSVDGVYVSGGFFSTLGVSAVLGRTLTVADDVRGGGRDGPVAVITHGLWQRRFGEDPGIIGATLFLNDVPFTIIGVTPPGFSGIEVGRAFDVMLPLGSEPLINGEAAAIDNPRRLFLIIVLRLRSGQSLQEATAAMRAMQREILEVFAGAMPSFLKEPFTLVPATAGTSGGLRQRYQRPLLTVFVIALVVLLIACVNLANLLLARTTTRRRELGVRLALGSSRWRLARQLLVESIVLAGVGAAAGLGIAAWGSRALVAQLSTAVDRLVMDVPLDWRVLAFGTLITATSAVLFGLVPALRAARLPLIDAIKQTSLAFRGMADSRRRAEGSRRVGLASGLIVAQVMLSLDLVVAAGLLVRTSQRLAAVPLGFDSERVLLINLASSRANPENKTALYGQLVDAVTAVPGVTDVAASMWTPGSGAAGLLRDARGRSVSGESRALANFVTPGWFATYGIPLRAGRDIAANDTAAAMPVMVVDEAFVRRFFPDRSPLGETVVDPDSTFLNNRTVVGVVGDVVYGSPRDAVAPTIYLPLAQSVELQRPGALATISVRSAAGRPTALAQGVGAAISAVDGDLDFSFRPLVDQVNREVAQERLAAVLSMLFGGLALLLAGVGLYGVIAYTVSRRTAEIGIRMALGARRADITALVLRQSVVLTGLGIVFGLATAVAVTRYLQAMLFGVTPLDATTFLAVSVLFALVAAVAAYVPARRATKVDPLVALRCE